MKKIYYLSCYKPNDYGDGGEKRTTQIFKILKEKFDISISNDYYNEMNQFSFISKLLSITSKNDFLPEIKSKNLKLNIKEGIKFYRRCFKDSDLIIWDIGVAYSWSDFIVPIAAKEEGIPILGICHNLNSLVKEKRSYFNNLNSPLWLSQEISILKLCNNIISISQEENWLLNLHDIASYYLPYDVNYSSYLKDSFRKINTDRTKIVNNNENFFLILGTAHNLPTYNGMKELLEWIKDSNFKFRVAGFGTEVFKEYQSLNIDILGAISQESLLDSFLKCKAVIINGNWSSGALTKIPELVAAGVPIIANYAAVRSQASFNHIYTYLFKNDLIKLLEIDNYLAPSKNKYSANSSITDKKLLEVVEKLLVQP